MTILYKFLNREEDIELTMKASQIIEHYGYEHQAFKLLEEAGELIAASVRAINDETKESNEHALEELADVTLVLEQIVGSLSAKEGRRLAQIVIAKADRQLRRISQEQEARHGAD